MYSPSAPRSSSSPLRSPDGWLDGLQLDPKPLALFDPCVASPPSSPTSSSSGNSHRKRQRPLFADMKLEFAGFEVGPTPADGGGASYLSEVAHATSAAAQAPVVTHMSHVASTSGADKPAELLGESAAALFRALRLPLAQDAAALHAAAERLAQQGFDTAAALAFAAPNELRAAGLAPADVAAVVPAARQRFATALALPPALAPHVPVAHWLASCGIPAGCAVAYAERLARLGYAHTLELELALHDSRAVAQLALGHGRLFLHCVSAAVHAQQLQLQQQQQQQQSFLFSQQHAAQPMLFASSSAMLQPLDLQRESELDALIHDGFLDALMDPAPDAADDAAQPAPMPASGATAVASDAMLKPIIGSAAASSAFPAANHHPVGALRLPPPDVVQLLYEAVNLPRPNPCRRGKKVYWSVLATNGMKDPRFARLAAYSPAELQSAYLRQFELPAGHVSTPSSVPSAAASSSASSASSGKSDAWSEENIKQLERAVKDPRCRHLSKVCWEMLATGRTGVDEYAPLAKFSASQLRSRFRSLFGDKRPQKLRQKKQMLKVQQLQMQQQLKQQQQQQQGGSGVKKEPVLL